MHTGKSTLERAIDLARSSDCRDIGEIRRKLKAEGYSGIEEHRGGRAIGDQLRKLIAGRG